MFEITMQRPESLEALWGALDEHAGDYKILAGGTDLVVEGRMGHNLGKVWVDITAIPAMNTIELRDDHLWIGATATWGDANASPHVQKYMPAMITCCFEMGSPQVRNIGTLAGNVANASPAGDSVPVLLAYDTRVVLKSKTGERTMLVEEFLVGVRKHKLEPGEIIWGFEVPLPEAHEAVFLKLGPRESLAISKVNAAVRARNDGGKLVDVRIAVGSAAPTVFRAHDAEALLEGQPIDGLDLTAACQAAQDRSSTITDLRSTKEYRTAMVKILVRRGLEEVIGKIS